MISSKARWIWINTDAQPNEYAYFEDVFDWNGERAIVFLASETDYILYVNGQRAAFGQFAGYPHQKYADEIDVTQYCKKGKNTLSITVRYEGVNSATHIDDGAGVIFSLALDGCEAVYSGVHTHGGYDHRYIQHVVRKITTQLGLTSGMRSGARFEPRSCVEVVKTYNIKLRPVQKTVVGEPKGATPVLADGRIYDLGCETAGYLFLRIRAAQAGELQVAYGEHLADGCVRQHISERDFSLDFSYDAGEHSFEQFFVRVAARYLQIKAPEGVEVLAVGLYPTLYPVTERSHCLSGLDEKIYDTSVRTLRLCMNLHYEDCPWREQALYVLDSRNQMLCGYYAFEESNFARANLVFISRGTRPDGLLELTYPAINTPAIPFFTLMYPVAVYEYIKHTDDKSILAEVMPTMRTFMERFRSRVDENGLLAEFGPPYWNFYEWTPNSDGAAKDGRYHLLLNCAYVYSCAHFQKLCEMAGERFEVDVDCTKRAIENTFLDRERGIFFLSPACPDVYTQLGNAMALLIDLGDERTVNALKNDKTLTPATLSMLTFVYDALICRDANSKAYILADMRQKYGQMLAANATSFWETIEGESAFCGAGSLCHGWSAIPVYYYHILGLCE